MKFLPCARKMSATSTVGRLTLPFSAAGSVCHRVLKWEQLRWDYSRTVSAGVKDGDRLSLLPNRNDRAASESFSDRSHAPTDVWPSCAATNEERPSSGFLHVVPLHRRRNRPF